jgi:hypothetical protein
MKSLFLVLSLLALGSMNASADWGQGGPGWGGGGPGWGGGGPGWGGGGPGWDHGGGWDHGPGGPGWDHGGGWGHGPGGPGWGHGPGFPPPGGPGYPPPPPPPQPRTQYVQCDSTQYRFNTCFVNGYVQSAQLVRQDSMSSCDLGSSWGYQQNSVWVDKGCRGMFLVYLY